MATTRRRASAPRTSPRSATRSRGGLQDDPYWQPFFAGYPPRPRVARARADPDVAVVVYNDHGLNFFLDKMPTFAVGAAPEYRNADEGWGLPTLAPYPGDPNLSWHMIESLVSDEFDVTTCQEMLVDHAFTVPQALLWPGGCRPVNGRCRSAVNTVQHPLPSPLRCFKLGQAMGRAIASYPQDERVVVLGTGGLSHQLDGERAGLHQQGVRPDVPREDRRRSGSARALLDSRPRASGRHAGSRSHHRGSSTRGALDDRACARCISHYHIPVSNTAAGLLVLENAA